MLSHAIRIIHLYRIRCYSTQKQALKLWVKNNGSPSTQVPIKSCINIDDFEKVQEKLNTKYQVALFTSLEQDPLDPGLAIKDLLKTNLINTSKTPLFVKIIPITPESIAAKMIYIAETTKNGTFTGEYKQKILRNDPDLAKVLKEDGYGLFDPSMPETVLTDFDDIRDGKKYHIYVHDGSKNVPIMVQKNETDAMDAETFLSIKTFLMEKLVASSIDLPADLYESKGIQTQKWDGVLLSEDAIYLLEAKNSMSVDQVKEMASRVQHFSQMMKPSTQNILIKYRKMKIVGIACAKHFSDESRMEARRLGLIIIVDPSLGHYAS